MECSRPDCHMPVEFYIVDFDAIAREEGKCFDFDYECERWIVETDWVKLIREGKIHGQCAKGHELLPIPPQRYGVSKRQGHLPSQHDAVKWSRVVS
jgi:hypothetical protein